MQYLRGSCMLVVKLQNKVQNRLITFLCRRPSLQRYSPPKKRVVYVGLPSIPLPSVRISLEFTKEKLEAQRWVRLSRPTSIHTATPRMSNGVRKRLYVRHLDWWPVKPQSSATLVLNYIVGVTYLLCHGSHNCHVQAAWHLIHSYKVWNTPSVTTAWSRDDIN